MESKVVDSRPTDEGGSIRRRRECHTCNKRFTTYETVESLPLIIVKKDGSRETFEPNKILSGLVKACEKRTVPFEVLQNAVMEIEQKLRNSLHSEIKSEYVGELVMEHLKQIDEVAYVRFASVYRQFKDIDSFMAELNNLLKTK